MPEGMEGEGRGIQAHVRDPSLEPEVVLRPGERDKFPRSIRDLEDRSAPKALVLAVDVDETQYSLDRTKKGIFCGGKRYEVLTSTKLVIFRFLYRYNNAITDVVFQRPNILPAKNHLKVDFLRILRDQIATSKHGKIVEEGESLENMECGVAIRCKM